MSGILIPWLSKYLTDDHPGIRLLYTADVPSSVPSTTKTSCVAPARVFPLFLAPALSAEP